LPTYLLLAGHARFVRKRGTDGGAQSLRCSSKICRIPDDRVHVFRIEVRPLLFPDSSAAHVNYGLAQALCEPCFPVSARIAITQVGNEKSCGTNLYSQAGIDGASLRILVQACQVVSGLERSRLEMFDECGLQNAVAKGHCHEGSPARRRPTGQLLVLLPAGKR